MKIRLLRKGIILVTCTILLWSASAFAAEIIRIQGVVMGVALKKNTMIVNEELFLWDTNTKFFNEYASPITADKIKLKSWVYIEGVANEGKPTAIQKIYLLPKYIPREERDRYSFMK